MSKPLLGEKLAVLVANGFCENDMLAAQRALQDAGADIRIISMDHGLVNSWNGTGWGLNFAADKGLNEALAADFSMLLIPGGQRSLDKLKLTAHTKRFIGGFLDAGKPTAILGDAISLLFFVDKAAGRTLAGPEALKEEAQTAGANWSDETHAIDSNLITGRTDDDYAEGFAAAVRDFFISSQNMDEAA